MSKVSNICPVCRLKLSNKNQLIDHLLCHIEKTPNDALSVVKETPIFICDFCRSNFTRKTHLIRHLKLIHYQFDEPKPKKNVTKKPRRKNLLQSYEEILEHDESKGGIEVRRTNKESSECPHCGNRFSIKKNLQKHLHTIHGLFDVIVDLEERKPKIGHRCSECAKVFSLRKNLYQHLRKIHGKTNVGRKASIAHEKDKLICDACGVGFGGKKSLMRHLRFKHSVKFSREKKTVAMCIHCNSTFAHKKSLYKHERKFHGAEYKKNLNGGSNSKTKTISKNPGSIENYACLKEILPENYDYKLTQFTWLKENSANWFKAKFYFACDSKEDIKKWKESYEMRNKLCLRVLSFPPPRTVGVLYKGRFRCHHNTMPKKGAKPNAKHTACSAILSVTLLQCNRSDLETSLKASIFVKNTHNHILGDPAFLKYRKPIDQVKEKFLKFFEQKKSVPQALAIHRSDLQMEYGSEQFSSVVNDRAFMPDARWAYGLYYNYIKKKRFTEGECHSRNITELRTVFEKILQRCESSPSYFHSAALHFISTYETCTSDDQLFNALFSFGAKVKYSKSKSVDTSSNERLSQTKEITPTDSSLLPNTIVAVQESNVYETRSVSYTFESNKYDNCILYPIENRQNVSNCWIAGDYGIF